MFSQASDCHSVIRGGGDEWDVVSVCTASGVVTGCTTS